MRTTEERFWSKVKHRPGGCWEWTGALNRHGSTGYGRVNINGNFYLAHRYSYEIEYGPIPNGMCVCHTCDNRICVRPSHLFIGTHKDNMIDRDTKGRVAKGSKSGRAKLTEAQVKTILKDTRPYKDIAKNYIVDRSIISKIKTRKIWKHVR